MPSANGQNHFTMEKKLNPANSGGDSSFYICTECGDGFSQYSNLLTHMAVHGPLDSFAFDGSSNGFEVPREYVLQENGTLTVVNGMVHSPVKPLSPGILPSHLASPIMPLSPTHRPQTLSYRDVFKPKPADPNLDRSYQGYYRCEICHRSFTSLQSLHRHQQYRNTERGYKCTLCCKIFEHSQDLKKHLQNHVGERFHSCNFCGKRFVKVDALNAHQTENHPAQKAPTFSKQDKKLEKTYTCKKCKLNFFWMSDFQTHSLNHCKGKEPSGLFTSEIEVEVNLKNLEESRDVFHSNGTSVDVKSNRANSSLIDESCEMEYDFSSTPYRCGLCGDRFHNLTTLKEHHLTHQTQEEIDQLNQESQKQLKRRIPPKARRRRGSNPNGKLHPCKHCHRVFNHSSSLSRHMRYHKGTMHTCVFCGRQFPQRCDLRRHVVMYHKTELDKKPSLKLLYTSTENLPLPRALEINKNTSPYEDNAKSSSDSEEQVEESPKEKLSVKGGRGNYKCQECGKKFGLLCVYQRHLRYHKKEPSKSPQGLTNLKDLSSFDHLQNSPSPGQVDDMGKTPHRPSTSVSPVFKEGNTEDDVDGYMAHSQSTDGNPAEALYECTECTETFSLLETFLQHQASHSSENNG